MALDPPTSCRQSPWGAACSDTRPQPPPPPSGSPATTLVLTIVGHNLDTKGAGTTFCQMLGLQKIYSMCVYSKSSEFHGEFKNDGKTRKKNLTPPPPPTLAAGTHPRRGNFLFEQSYFDPNMPTPQNDQRDMAIILKSLCWGTLDPPPPQLPAVPPPPPSGASGHHNPVGV